MLLAGALEEANTKRAARCRQVNSRLFSRDERRKIALLLAASILARAPGWPRRRAIVRHTSLHEVSTKRLAEKIALGDYIVIALIGLLILNWLFSRGSDASGGVGFTAW